MRPLDPAALFMDFARLIRQHGWRIAGLCLMGALLGIFATWLQGFAPDPERPEVALVLAFIAKLPLEMYAFPRFVMELDARRIDHPTNPLATWQDHFEARWFRAFLAKLLLYLTIGGGLSLLILPGLIVGLFFGST